MQSFIFKTISVLALGFMANTAQAQTEEHRQGQAHVHGHGRINIAIDGQDMLLTLEAPAMNFLGFEHVPQTQEQEDLLMETRNMLADYQSVFVLHGAVCTQLAADIDFGSLAVRHDDHAGHDHGHDHNHEHSHDNHDDIFLQYTLRCRDSGPVSTALMLFNTFPGFEEIAVQWITGSGQGGMRVNSANTVIAFGRAGNR